MAHANRQNGFHVGGVEDAPRDDLVWPDEGKGSFVELARFVERHVHDSELEPEPLSSG
jgi:hypothetical protein